MDISLGRSKNQFISILLFIVNEVDESTHLPASAYAPSSMDSKLGRSIIHSNHSNT